MNVLILEPNAPIADFLQAVIEWPDHTVRVVGSPHDARIAAAHTRPDAIVLPDAIDGDDSVALADALGLECAWLAPAPAPAIVVTLMPGTLRASRRWSGRGVVTLRTPASVDDLRRCLDLAGARARKP